MRSSDGEATLTQEESLVRSSIRWTEAGARFMLRGRQLPPRACCKRRHSNTSSLTLLTPSQPLSILLP